MAQVLPTAPALVSLGCFLPREPLRCFRAPLPPAQSVLCPRCPHQEPCAVSCRHRGLSRAGATAPAPIHLAPAALPQSLWMGRALQVEAQGGDRGRTLLRAAGDRGQGVVAGASAVVDWCGVLFLVRNRSCRGARALWGEEAVLWQHLAPCQDPGTHRELPVSPMPPQSLERL